MNSVGARIRVSGLVQGVGFRYYTIRRALELGVTGWVKNNFDGSVEVAAEGDRGSVEEMIAFMRTGPPSARVSDVVIEWQQYSGKYDTFDITG